MKQGLAIHVHHDMLIDFCWDYDERVKVIKTTKPVNEREIRLRLFKILPQEAIDELPKRLVKALTEWNKIYTEWKQAYAKRVNVYDERKQTYAERDKELTEWDKIYTEFRQADAKWGKNRETWHKKFCGCSEWNGREIVFKP